MRDEGREIAEERQKIENGKKPKGRKWRECGGKKESNWILCEVSVHVLQTNLDLYQMLHSKFFLDQLLEVGVKSNIPDPGKNNWKGRKKVGNKSVKESGR